MIEARKILILLAMLTPLVLQAQDEAPSQTLIKNVNVWDGLAEKAVKGQDVLIEGNKVAKVGKNLSASGATVIRSEERRVGKECRSR